MHVVRSIALSLTAVTALGVAPAVAAPPHRLVAVAVVAPPSDESDLVRLRNRVVDDIEATIDEVSAKQDMIWASDLTDEQKYAESMGTRYDQQGLTALAGSAGEATTVEQVRGYAGDLRRYYPHVYDLAVSYLHRTNLLGAQISANDATLAQLPDGYADRVADANQAARTALGYPTGTDRGSDDGRSQAAGYRSATAALSTVREQLRLVRRIQAEAHRFALLQNQLIREVQSTTTQLSQAQLRVAASVLTDEQKQGIGYLIENDQHNLSHLVSAASAATSLAELVPLVSAASAYRPHAYDVLLTEAVQGPRLQRRITENSLALASVTDRDVRVGVTANAAAAAAVARASRAAGDLTGTSGRSETGAVRHELAEARRQLRLVRRVLAAVSH